MGEGISGSASSSGATGRMGGNSEFGSYGNSGIGGASGSSSGAGGAAVEPVTFNFNSLTQTLSLPNGDKIRMDKNCNVFGLEQNRVQIVMEGTGGSSQRGVSLCKKSTHYASGLSCREVLVKVQGISRYTTDISVMDLHSNLLAL